MSLISKLIHPAPQNAALTLPQLIAELGQSSTSTAGESVSSETAKCVATAYRCGNVISDDVAKMTMQVFTRSGKPGEQIINRMLPDAMIQNLAWQSEMQPNHLMIPTIFKKTVVQWMMFWGAAYIWSPPSSREWIVLPSDRTFPMFSLNDGSLWYSTIFPNNVQKFLPDVEVLHLLLNSTDGITGRSVIRYARDTIGKQLAAYRAQGKLFKQGMNPSAILWTAGQLGPTGRATVREAYEEAMSGEANTGRLAILDNRITKFEPITMKLTDAQFLESIQATDVDIANFFGLPLYKLNSGKQSYQSNEQQDNDYLKTTLEPYVKQWEEAAAVRWVPTWEQGKTYFKFDRDAVLSSNAAVRADINLKRIGSGTLTPNQALEREDMSSYPEGNKHFVQSNWLPIEMAGKTQTPPVNPGKGN